MDTIVVLPAYNEADNIVEVIRALDALNCVDAIVVVDDCSTDETTAKASREDVVLIRNPVNLQKGGSLKRGYDEARELGADAIVRMDADGQHNPEEVPSLVDRLERGDDDYLIGNRISDDGRMPLDRYFGNRVVSLATSLRVRQMILDPTSGFRAFDADFLDVVPYSEFSEDYQFEIDEILAFRAANADIGELAVDCIYGNEESNLTYVDGLKYLYTVFSSGP